MYTYRTMCGVLEELRELFKTCDFSPFSRLVEDIQGMTCRMLRHTCKDTLDSDDKGPDMKIVHEIIDVITDMKVCIRTGRYSEFPGLIEHHQSLGNLLESIIEAQHDFEEERSKAKKAKEERKKLTEELERVREEVKQLGGDYGRRPSLEEIYKELYD